MASSGHPSIRIPFSSAQKYCLGIISILTAGFLMASRLDTEFLLGFAVLIIPWIGVIHWVGTSPGKIEYVSQNLHLLKCRSESLPILYNGDNWERNIIPTQLLLDLSKTGFRWKDDRLSILTPVRTVYLGSGNKMLPILDWLVQHGMQSK